MFRWSMLNVHITYSSINLLKQKEISLTILSAYSDNLPFPSVTLCPSYINKTRYKNFSEVLEDQPPIESLLLGVDQKMGDKV